MFLNRLLDRLEAARGPLFREDPEELPAIERMYDAAKRRTWDENTIIDWSLPFDLPGEDRANVAQMLGYLYYGERAAFAVASQMIERVPHEAARRFLSLQTADEARHMKALGRAVRAIGELPEPDPFQRIFVGMLSRENKAALKLLGLQLVAENVANQLFLHLKSSLKDPRLVELLTAIQADESRHVGFGHVYLGHLLGRENGLFYLRLHFTFLIWAGLGTLSMLHQRKTLKTAEVDVEQALAHVIEDYRKALDRIESTAGKKIPIYFPLRAVERIARTAIRALVN